MQNSDRKGSLYMVAASICWSFGGLCIKFIPWGAMSIIGLRALLAAAVFVIFRKSFKVELTRGNVMAAVCLSATNILFVFANKLTTAAAAILLQFTAPIFIILINLVFYRKRPERSAVLAVAVTFLGMLLFFADGLKSGSLPGNILAVLSGLAFAGVFVCNKRPDTNTENALFLGFLINAVIGLPFAFFQVSADALAWGAVLFLGIVQVGLAYVFFSLGIKRTTALLACLITAMEPVLNPVWVMLAGILGWLPEVETPGTYAVAGGVVIVLTVIWYNIHVERQTTGRPSEPTI